MRRGSSDDDWVDVAPEPDAEPADAEPARPLTYPAGRAAGPRARAAAARGVFGPPPTGSIAAAPAEASATPAESSTVAPAVAHTAAHTPLASGPAPVAAASAAGAKAKARISGSSAARSRKSFYCVLRDRLGEQLEPAVVSRSYGAIAFLCVEDGGDIRQSPAVFQGFATEEEARAFVAAAGGTWPAVLL